MFVLLCRNFSFVKIPKKMGMKILALAFLLLLFISTSHSELLKQESICVDDSGEMVLCEQDSHLRKLTFDSRSILLKVQQHLDENQVAEAINILLAALNPSKDDKTITRREAALLHHALAVIHIRNGEYRLAATQAANCIQRDTAANDCYFIKGYAEAVKGNIDTAKKDFLDAWEGGLHWWLGAHPPGCKHKRLLHHDWFYADAVRIKNYDLPGQHVEDAVSVDEQQCIKYDDETCKYEFVTQFAPREIVLIRLRNHYIWGSGAYACTDCQMLLFGEGDLLMGRPKFNESAVPLELSHEICLLNQRQNNHYHWTIEALSRIWILQQIHISCKYIIISPNEKRLSQLRMFGIDTNEHDDAAVENTDEPSGNYGILQYDESYIYKTKRLVAADWRINPESVEAKTSISWAFLPPKIALQNVQEILLNHSQPLPKPKQNVIYFSRRNELYRRVMSENILIEELNKLIGEEHFLVVDGTKDLSAIEEATLFYSAGIVIGPHGAGLSNILYCQPGSLLIEFPTGSKIDSYFAYVASALQIKYKGVPQLKSHIYGHFTMTTALSQLIAKSVEEHWNLIKNETDSKEPELEDSNSETHTISEDLL